MHGKIPAARVALIERIAERARRLRIRRLPVAADELVRAYYHGVAEEDLALHQHEALARAALQHLGLAEVRRPGETLVRVFNPSRDADGFDSSRTMVLVATDDMPFLVDSLGIVFAQSGLNVHFLVHPVLIVSRDRRGRLTALHQDAPRAGALYESWQLIEIDREGEPARLEALRRRILETLDDVRCATTDWAAMRGRAREIVAELQLAPPPVPAAETDEARALLEWMEDNHFTFLGYREYRLRRGRSHDLLEALPETGLGVLRAGRRRAAGSPTRLAGEIRKFARSNDLLIITKANSMSTVHRATHLDYVGLKTFDARGRITGEQRFIGLWTSTTYSASPRDIPVLRHKVQRVVSIFGLAPSSHDGKAVLHALESYPRDELFQATVPDLVRIVRGIVNLYERYEVRLFLRRDAFRRFYTLLLYVPRDRYNTQVRHRIERLAMETLGGLAIESQVQLSQSVLVRLQMLVRTDPDSPRRVDATALERRIEEAVRTWPDGLRQALEAALPDDVAASRFRRWGTRSRPPTTRTSRPRRPSPTWNGWSGLPRRRTAS
jgi:glutamate dehydrogenase